MDAWGVSAPPRLAAGDDAAGVALGVRVDAGVALAEARGVVSGDPLGADDGTAVGAAVTTGVGLTVGRAVGRAVGFTVGPGVGSDPPLTTIVPNICSGWISQK